MPRNNSRQRRDTRYEAALTRQRHYLQDYQAGTRKHKPAPVDEFMRPVDLAKLKSQPDPEPSPQEQSDATTDGPAEETATPESPARPLARRRRVRKGR